MIADTVWEATDLPDSRYFLTTARLGFRLWSCDDLPLAIGLWGDPRVTALIGGPRSEDEIAERLGREIAMLETFGVQYWPIFLLEDDRHAGCAGLRPYRLDDGIYELGFHLRPEHWGRGLAAEAGRAVMQFAFEVIGATALFAGHHPANAASRNVLGKLGFEFTHEEYYSDTGVLHPSYLVRH